jgi:hypothetical protein
MNLKQSYGHINKYMRQKMNMINLFAAKILYTQS